MSDLTVAFPGDIAAKIVKWKVKKGGQVGKGTVLCHYKTLDSDIVHKLKSNDVGTILELCIKENDDILPGAVAVKLEGCSHPTVMKDMCAECGADLRQTHGLPGDRRSSVSASVAMVHSVPELIVSEKQAMELGHEDERRLLSSRKLALLVDLDQTLIHTTNDNVPPNLKDVYHFRQWHGQNSMWYHTKFRPGTEQFLESISKLFEMHIVTFGARMYAHTIGNFLDPHGKLFSHRILSRDECFNATSKTANLKALFPCGDSMVCIIDDRDDVWNHSPNLVQVKPYIFFDGTADINAPPGLEKGGNRNGATKHKSRIVRVPKNKTESVDIKEMKTQQSKEEKKEESVGDESKKEDAESPGEKGDGDIVRNNIEETGNSAGSVEDRGDAREESAAVVRNGKENESENEEWKNKVGDEEKKNEDIQTEENNDELTVNEEMEVDEDGKKETKEKANKEDCEQDKDQLSEGEVKDEEEYEEMVEWDDDDDYLIYLQDILTRIHTAFFELYDQGKKKDELPNLKKIIPYVKRKVLRGANLVFSGVVPTNANLEKSRAYRVAKSLGANVQESFVLKSDENSENATSHVVAARPGTTKVNAARKQKHVHTINPNWLWTCAERWERVDERLFKLEDDKNLPPAQDSPVPRLVKRKSEKRKKSESDPDLSGMEKDSKSTKLCTEMEEKSKDNSAGPSRISLERRFSDTYNPLYTFSSDDIADMDKEVEEIFDESDSEDSEEEMRRIVLGKKRRDSSSEESMSGEFPKGWGPKGKQNIIEVGETEVGAQEEEEEVEQIAQPDELFKHSDSESEAEKSFDESIGSVDEEMAAAVEKEFLSF